MRETGGFELASTITLVLQANRLTKCASHNYFHSEYLPFPYGSRYRARNTWHTAFIFDNITNELEEYLLEEQVESDYEDGLFSIAESVTNRLQEDYDELTGDDTNKNRFIKSLTKVFALLLNTKVDTVDKIKRILRIAIKTTLKIWEGQK